MLQYPKNYREKIAEEFKNLNYGIEAEVSFETDGYRFQDLIKIIYELAENIRCRREDYSYGGGYF